MKIKENHCQEELKIGCNHRYFLAFVFFVLQALSFKAAAQVPVLIDVNVIKTSEGYGFDKSWLQFHQYQEYLLLINNDYAENIIFSFQQFGQKIATHYLQGPGLVSQDSIDLPGKTKVLWQFSAAESGEFEYYLSESSQSQRGTKAKITIHADIQSLTKPDLSSQGEAEESALQVPEIDSSSAFSNSIVQKNQSPEMQNLDLDKVDPKKKIKSHR